MRTLSESTAPGGLPVQRSPAKHCHKVPAATVNNARVCQKLLGVTSSRRVDAPELAVFRTCPVGSSAGKFCDLRRLREREREEEREREHVQTDGRTDGPGWGSG